MSKRVLFSLFLILLITLTAFNVYVQRTASNDKLQAEMQHLQKENQQMIKERKSLKKTLNRMDPSKVQAQHDALVEQVSSFIETAFVHEKENYQKRKEQAQAIMSSDLVDTFFPTDNYKANTKTAVNDVETFIKTGDLSNNHATVLVRLKHTLYSLQSNRKQVSPVFLELNAQLQNDHWVITDFKDVRKERNE
ncbi:hypothetical protein ACGTN9_17445 [Halobacillus sp. MO56]